MCKCFFVSDLHGSEERYKKLFNRISIDKPRAVFMGGDLLPHGYSYKQDVDHFISNIFAGGFLQLRSSMKDEFPEVFLILGNDDPKINLSCIEKIEKEEALWKHAHMKSFSFEGFIVFGYANVPPTPFRLKDWEKYDVSRFVDPGCIHPTEGMRSVQPEENIKYSTIKKDLEKLINGYDLSKAVFLFHSPPYKTDLDRAALDGQMIDHVPLDVHVGSIAIKEFIEEKKPCLSLHGHIHESTRLTGNWKQKIGSTWSYNAANDSKELSIVAFDLDDPASAVRNLY